MHKHRHFVFDFDGTVADLHVDWNKLREEVYHTFHKRYGFASKSLLHMYESILCGKEEYSRQELIGIIRRFEQPGGIVVYRPIDRIVKLLRELPVFYIISSNLHFTVQQVLGELDLLTSCRAIIGLDDVSAIKPSPVSFEMLTAVTGDPDPERYLYVGDRDTDRKFASRAGINFLFPEEIQ